MNKFKTESKHDMYGDVKVGCSWKDQYLFKGELKIQQCNERIYLTTDQIIELRDLLNYVIEKEKLND